MKPLFNRQGGKYYLKKTIIPYIPKTTVYVEPFVGGGSIYLNTPKSSLEVINDLDTGLIRIYRSIKEDGDVSHLVKKYTQDDFFNIFDSKPQTEREYVERRIIVKALSYLSSENRCYNIHHVVSKHKADNIMKCHDRLKDTIIENEDYKKIISKYDSPETFFYLDPPYENSSKTVRKDLYTDINLSELSDILKNIKGKFLLSINDSERTRELFKDYIITEVSTRYSLKKRTVNELLIRNYSI